MAVRVAAGDNGSCTDNGMRPQVNSGQDDGVHAQPAVVTNADGGTRKVTAKICRIVISTDEAYAGAKLATFADFYAVDGLDVAPGHISRGAMNPAPDPLGMHDPAGKVHGPRDMPVDAQNTLEKNPAKVLPEGHGGGSSKQPTQAHGIRLHWISENPQIHQ
jgi:hypothetical protein